MKRPIPLILSAIVLGLLTLMQLLGAVTMAGVAIFSFHKPLPAPTTPLPFPPSFLPLMMLGMALFFAALAAWSITTLIGLVRLRSWARYSILTIAGCMAFFGGTSALMSFVLPFVTPALPNQPPGANPAILRGIFFATGAFYGIFALIGIALFIYYNLASVRALFLQDAPVNLDPPRTVTGKPRPTAITVLSMLFLISGPFCALGALIRYPLMLCGFFFYGWTAHVLYLCFALVSFTLGYGLFRLYNAARLGMYAWMVFGLLNMLVMATPWGMHRFTKYSESITAQMYSSQGYPGLTQPPNPFLSPHYFFFCFALGAAFNLILFWILHRHRAAFTPAPPPPPMPILNTLDTPVEG